MRKTVENRYFGKPKKGDVFVMSDCCPTKTAQMLAAELIPRWQNQCAVFARAIKAPTTKKTGQNIYDFCRKNINYQKDPKGFEFIRSPNSSVADGLGDCEDYVALVSCTLLCLGIAHQLRVTDYGKGYQHIYVVLNGVVIDPVASLFNFEQPYVAKIDYEMNHKSSGLSVLRNAVTQDLFSGVASKGLGALPKTEKASQTNAAIIDINNKEVMAMFKPFVGGHGVFFDEKKQFVAAWDGPSLLLLKSNAPVSGTGFFGLNGEKIEKNAPDFLSIFKAKSITQIKINLDALQKSLLVVRSYPKNSTIRLTQTQARQIQVLCEERRTFRMYSNEKVDAEIKGDVLESVYYDSALILKTLNAVRRYATGKSPDILLNIDNSEHAKVKQVWGQFDSQFGKVVFSFMNRIIWENDANPVTVFNKTNPPVILGNTPDDKLLSIQKQLVALMPALKSI